MSLRTAHASADACYRHADLPLCSLDSAGHASSEVVAFLKSGPVWPKTSSPIDNELSLWCELVVDNFNRTAVSDSQVNRPGFDDCSGYWVTASRAVGF